MKRLLDRLGDLLALLLVLALPLALACLCGALDWQAATSGPNF